MKLSKLDSIILTGNVSKIEHSQNKIMTYLKSRLDLECFSPAFNKKSCILQESKTAKATITRCDISATILFKLVDSYLIAFKFTQ